MLSTISSLSMNASRITSSVRNVRSRPDPMSRVAVLRRSKAEVVPGQQIPPTSLSSAAMLEPAVNRPPGSWEDASNEGKSGRRSSKLPPPAGSIDPDAIATESTRRTNDAGASVERSQYSGGIPSTLATPITNRATGRHHRASGSVRRGGSDPVDAENTGVGVDLDEASDYPVDPI